MGRSDKSPEEFWAKGELGFFDHYIIPLAKKLKDCGVFGVSSGEYLNYATQNVSIINVETRLDIPTVGSVGCELKLTSSCHCHFHLQRREWASKGEAIVCEMMERFRHKYGAPKAIDKLLG